MHPIISTRPVVFLMIMAPGGLGCVHVHQPEHQIYVISEDAKEVGTGLASGGAGRHDCQKEHEECMELCWNKRYPWPHSQEQAGWYYKRCASDCVNQYKNCMDEEEAAAREKAKKLEFSRMDQAIEWIKQHKDEVVIGTIVVVGGVAFVLATGGSGALILAPLAAL